MPNLLRRSAEPIPERSRIAGDPIAPADSTINRDARTVRTAGSASGRTNLSLKNSTPTARLFLEINMLTLRILLPRDALLTRILHALLDSRRVPLDSRFLNDYR